MVGSEKYFVKIELRRDPTSSTSDLYEDKISLFEHGNLEDFILLICNLNMNLAATGTLEMNAKIQYLRRLVHG